MLTSVYPSIFIVLYATELCCEILSALCLVYSNPSNYKTYATVNHPVGIALNGAVMLISEFYTGSISDCQLVMSCSIAMLLFAPF